MCSIGEMLPKILEEFIHSKYGTTTNNILGIEVVLMDGTITRIGGKVFDSGYDLLGLITGSEGLLCVITEVTVKILKNPILSKKQYF